jgi:hypothetical protein
MRMFKRLFPVFLVTILLAGLATAQAAGVTRNSHTQSVAGLTSHFRPGDNNQRFDFGTVVRDTADDQSVAPGRWQAPRNVSLWHSFLTWNWFSLQIPR